eukprot:gene8618-biopygen14762
MTGKRRREGRTDGETERGRSRIQTSSMLQTSILRMLYLLGGTKSNAIKGFITKIVLVDSLQAIKGHRFHYNCAQFAMNSSRGDQKLDTMVE